MAPPVIWSPAYEVELGPHVFVTAKYRLARERRIADRTLTEGDFVPPIAASRDELARAHTDDFLSKVETDSLVVRRTGAVGGAAYGGATESDGSVVWRHASHRA